MAHFYHLTKPKRFAIILPMTNTRAAVEARRRALMAARRVAIDNRDWAAMNELTKRLCKLPVKGEKDYPRA